MLCCGGHRDGHLDGDSGVDNRHSGLGSVLRAIGVHGRVGLPGSHG